MGAHPGLLTFRMSLVLLKVGENGKLTRYHRNRRSNTNSYRTMRFWQISKDVESKLRHGSVTLFKNERAFHSLNPISELQGCLSILSTESVGAVPGLHHRALKSHKGFLSVGEGTTWRGCVHSPSPTHQSSRPFRPCWAFQVPLPYPAILFSNSILSWFHIFTEMKFSACPICNPDTTWVPFTV